MEALVNLGDRGATPVGSTFGQRRTSASYPSCSCRPEEVVPLHPFTADAAAALAGPDWLRARRRSAAERFAAASLPDTEEEVWRYSRVGELDLAAWQLVTGEASAVVPPSDDLLHDAAVTVTVVDGVATIGQVPAEWTAKGVVIATASSLDDEAASGLGVVASDGPDVFATLNDAFALDPVLISVPRGVQLEAPILVRHHLSVATTATFPRLVVRIGEGASATIVDQVSSGAEAVLSVPLTELEVARSGRLGYLHVQELGAAGWQLGSLVARVEQEGNLQAALVGLGGSYARIRTDCRLSGRGASGDLLAAYFGEGDQTLDFRTFQYHDAPDTTSNLLFKGAVGGHSRSVYTGLIRVDKNARGTNAFQTNRNVKLSDTAWAESVPNLEIETNDVHCSHASTVGPVDAEQRFYLESRGVTPRTADRLIVAGFFDEVVRALPATGAVAAVRKRIADKLDRTAGDLR
ncbi:MAG: Fe-S cluster assembly protein SufD [Acidimicrobiales bacterium]|nr:Fe-S cluster assembly protein SufD [Acidimicrobiales bacterium]